MKGILLVLVRIKSLKTRAFFFGEGRLPVAEVVAITGQKTGKSWSLSLHVDLRIYLNPKSFQQGLFNHLGSPTRFFFRDQTIQIYGNLQGFPTNNALFGYVKKYPLIQQGW